MALEPIKKLDTSQRMKQYFEKVIRNILYIHIFAFS